MSEKYGTIPKRFTKEWWDYFWTYYKWHTIIAIVVIILAASTIHQKITAPKYDLTIALASEQVYSQEDDERLIKKLTPLVVDVNNNGEKLLDMLVIDLGNKNDPEYTAAMQSKLDLSLAADDIFVYISDKKTASRLAGDSGELSVFAPLKDWYDGEIAADVICAGDTPVGISLAGNALFKELGTDMTDKYLLMRYKPRSDQKKQVAPYKAAIKFANKILAY